MGLQGVRMSREHSYIRTGDFERELLFDRLTTSFGSSRYPSTRDCRNRRSADTWCRNAARRSVSPGMPSRAALRLKIFVSISATSISPWMSHGAVTGNISELSRCFECTPYLSFLRVAHLVSGGVALCRPYYLPYNPSLFSFH